jgi:hypothetical protein
LGGGIVEKAAFGAEEIIEESDPGFGKRKREKLMQDLINTVMLLCASLAALAFGVLAAYGMLRAAFAVLRIHARSVAGAGLRVQRSAISVQK